MMTTPAMDEQSLSWEESACDRCGSMETEPVFEGPDRLEHLPGTFQVVRCRQCGLYRQNPRLAWDSLQHYYPSDYASHGNLVQDQAGKWRPYLVRYGPWKRLRAVEKYQNGGKLLEVGCGTGLFLEEAVRSGRWEVTGIEPTERVAQYAAEKLGVPILQSTFEDTSLPESEFDVIALWNVLEHLSQPVACLKTAHRLLKANGWLVFSIPNVDGLEARLFGTSWIGWDLPRHLFIFPLETVGDILAEVGFDYVGSKCISGSYALLGESLEFWSQGWQDRHPITRKLMLKIYYSALGRIALIPPLWLADRLKQSTLITIFAQKRQ
jgi:2-polyprenyl-3-methyl-5-hydroxy-6-metoxy-1,4-benzoquinol methylase